MRHLLIAPVSLLFIAVLAAPAFPQERQGSQRSYPMPKTLKLLDAELPIWVDASVGVTPKGELNAPVWGQNITRIRQILETPSDHAIYFNDKIVGYQDRTSAKGCRPVGPQYIDYPEPPRRATLDDAIADSKVVLLGRITAKRYGFYDADPGQLFQVEPIRSCGQRLTKPRYYFFMPVGRFQFAGVDICKTDDRYAEPPNIGDEVFLFVLPPSDYDGVLFHVLDAGDIVPVAADGSLRLPLQYAAQDQGAAKRSAVAPTKSDLLARRSSRSSWCSSM